MGETNMTSPVEVSVQQNMGASSPKFARVKKKAKAFIKGMCSMATLKKKLPITTWLPKYKLSYVQSDLIAGITVGLTVIPQGLAYASLASLPVQYGLYSAFMGCFVYCFLGTSKDITLGPTAIMSLMTSTFALSPVKNDATYAIVLTLISGIIQLFMGIFQLGIIVNFISYPVINAFTSAAAITIAFSQVKHIFGLTNIPRDFLHNVYYTFAKLGETRIWDFVMGASCIILLFIMKKLRTFNWKDSTRPEGLMVSQKVGRKIVWLFGTGANAVVVLSTAGLVAALESQGIIGHLTLTPHLPAGLPSFRPPAFSVQNGNTTISAGEIFSSIGAGFGVIPLIGLIETIAIGKAFARRNDYKIDPSQELIAIGAANVLSSFVSSYPVTGSFSRTAVNSQSDVKTPVSGLVTGALVLMALQLLTPLFHYIPTAALAAVIISAVLPMVDHTIIMKLWRTERFDLIPWSITLVMSFLIGIEYGIMLGIGISVLMLLYPLARPNFEVKRENGIWITLKFGLNFPAIEYIQEVILQEAAKGGKSVVLDMTHVASIDYTTIQGIKELVEDFKKKKMSLVFKNLQPIILHDLRRAFISDISISNLIEEDAELRVNTAEDNAPTNDPEAADNDNTVASLLPEQV